MNEISGKKQEARHYFDLGRQQKKAGDLTSAIASFKRAIQLQPNNFVAYNNLGNIFQSKGETDKAIVAWQKAALIKPDNAFVHNNLGQIWQLEAKPELALEAYKKAIAVKPDFALAYLNLAMLLHQKGVVKRAEQCYYLLAILRCCNQRFDDWRISRSAIQSHFDCQYLRIVCRFGDKTQYGTTK